MNLPGLITVQPDRTEELDALARMVGTCFLEEMWYVTWLEALDELGIGYELHEAPYDEADLSATAMARSLGVPVEEVFKTLVVRGDKTGVLEVCVPGAAELNLKELAAVSGNKHVEMVPLKEVQHRLYPGRLFAAGREKALSRLRGRKRHPP